MILAGKYELLKKIGSGGSSTVWLASDITLNKTWAVKDAPKEQIINGIRVENDLLTEARLMKNFNHPALPRVVDVIEEEDRFYIVMDYIEGEPLDKVLAKYGPQSQSQVVSWGLELASVLKYLHTQDPPIIYRDMKPANVILHPSGTLRLVDFGIARTYKPGKTQDTMPLGTILYAAPEQIMNSHSSAQSDVRTDIYNLGATLYELVTGYVPDRAPYTFVPARQIREDVSPGIEAVLFKCTRPDPKQRYQNIDEFAQALANYEKLDSGYVDKRKAILKKFAFSLGAGLICIMCAFLLFGIDKRLKEQTYESLINPVGTSAEKIESYEKAIELYPEKDEAYSLLMQEYSEGGINSRESESIYKIYNEATAQLDNNSTEFLDINMTVAKAYLTWFTGETDSSVRARLYAAYPFFKAVSSSENKEYEDKNVAEAYVMLAEFYRTYISGLDSTFAAEADTEDYRKLYNQLIRIINCYEKLDGEAQLKLSSCEAVTAAVYDCRSEFSKNISRQKAFELIDKTKKLLQGISSSNENVKKQKKEAENRLENVEKDLRRAYKDRIKT